MTLVVRACILLARLCRAGPALRTVSCPLGEEEPRKVPDQEGTRPAAASPGAGCRSGEHEVPWASELAVGGGRGTLPLPVGVSVLGCCAGIKMIPKETGASAGK